MNSGAKALTLALWSSKRSITGTWSNASPYAAALIARPSGPTGAPREIKQDTGSGSVRCDPSVLSTFQNF